MSSQITTSSKIATSKNPTPQYTKFIEKDYVKPVSTNQTLPLIKRDYYPTNNVLVEQKSKGSTIFLPGFMRLKFKNFNDLDIGGLSALLNGQIIFVVYYGQAFDFVMQDYERIPISEIIGYKPATQEEEKIEREKIKKKDQQRLNKFIQDNLMKKIVLLFARDNAIKLTNNEKQNKKKKLDIKVSHNEEKHEIKFTIKKIFKLYLDSQIFLTPFQVINGILEVTVQSITIKGDDAKFLNNKYVKKNNNFFSFNSHRDSKIQPTDGTEKIQENPNWKIQFNLQNHMHMKQKVQFTNWGTYGNYDLAEKKIGALYTNYRISEAKQFKMTAEQRKAKRDEDRKKRQKDEQEQKIQPFHYAYFNIPLYKFPLSAIITIFMPILFLDVLNFGILFQDPILSDRIATIATLVLAFAALIPTIRSQIPPNPTITLIEILVYFQTFPTLLAIIQSLQAFRQLNPAFFFNWAQNGFFWSALGVSSASILIVLVLLGLHQFKWYPEYNDVNIKHLKPVFDRTNWRNTECNKYFDYHFNQYDQNHVVIINELPDLATKQAKAAGKLGLSIIRG